MVNGAFRFHARVSLGERTAHVADRRAEMVAADIIEQSRLFTGLQAGSLLRVTIGAEVDMFQLVAQGVEAVQRAIAAEVEVALRTLARADTLLARFGPAAAEPFRRKAALSPSREADRLQTVEMAVGDVVLFDETGTIQDLPQRVEDRLRGAGSLTVGKPTPPMNADRLRERFPGRDIEELLYDYAALPGMSRIVEDPNIRRICSAFTLSGFQTRYSCEGHGWMLSHLKFVSSPEKLQELRELLDANAGLLREKWVIVEDHMDATTVRYTLHPENISGDVRNHYDNVLSDLDVIGMLVLSKFGKSGSSRPDGA